MFERFTKDARSAVVLAQEAAREGHAGMIDVVHVTLGVLKANSGAIDALQEAGLDADLLRRRLSDHARGSGLDEEALASLGIDFGAVNRAAEETFGEGALERAGLLAKLRGRQRAHIPFTKDAKKALELTLREAIRLGDKELTDRHILLAVLRAGGPVAGLLAADADEGTLRRALEGRPRAA